MCIARFNLYAQGLVRLIKERKSMTRYQEFTEWLGIALFVSWYAGVVSLLPTAGLRATYVLVATACCALLHDQIALSHWSRPIFSGKPTHFSGWFEHQLSGTLNITCPTWMDWVHGGLQFQIEHHLFPRLPRHNLRMVKPLVEKFARRHGVQYHDIGFVAANKEVLQAMWIRGWRRRPTNTRRASAWDLPRGGGTADVFYLAAAGGGGPVAAAGWAWRCGALPRSPRVPCPRPDAATLGGGQGLQQA